MKKPAIKEISDYCRSRGNGIDPEHFFDHYESVGWMRGKTPMKSWQATVRTWEKNAQEKTKQNNWVNQDELMEVAGRKSLQPRPGESWEEFSLRVARTR